jgi:Fe2+ or Zn2+ uptake regulation protein
LILETLRHAHTHPTAEELYAVVKQHMPSISLGTVYRNLNLLEELGMIRKVESAGSTGLRFDGRNDEHCHLVCSSCKKIMDVDLDYFAPIDAKVHADTGFTVSEHGIVLKGLCKDCAAN